jgi:hypothetical protein
MINHLENRLSEALHDIAGNAPHHLDLDKIERRGRHAKTRTILTRTGVTLGVAALVAVAAGLGATGKAAPKHSVDAAGGALSATSKAPPKHSFDATTTGTTGSATLIRLAGYVRDADPPTGDATEVIRTTTDVGKGPNIGADLFADDGRYFYSDDPNGLGAQVKADNNSANGVFGREVAIAQYAANGGDLATAQRRMAVAALDPGKPYRIVTTAPTLPPGLTKEQIKAHGGTGVPVVVLGSNDWSNSLDALLAGAGRPDVRAGVLRILSTVPDVTVSQSTTNGKPTLTLTETAKGYVSTYVESIVIGAQDGIPVELHGKDLSEPSVAVTVTYAVSRVTLSDLN